MNVIEVNAQTGDQELRAMTPEEIKQVESAAAEEAERWSSDRTINMVRAMRDVALNRLIGIGFVATTSGDVATVSAVLAARQAMLDLTKDPAVMSAVNEAELLAALQNRYAQIVSAAPDNVRTAFRDLRL